jgi:hypothetical protein
MFISILCNSFWLILYGTSLSNCGGDVKEGETIEEAEKKSKCVIADRVLASITCVKKI